jgi:cbb3-type cytochrome c oxidase subunit III
MAKFLLPSCVVFFIVTLAGSTATFSSGLSSHSDPQDALDGAQLYRTSCASCHGTSARGDGPLADLLRRRPSDLTVLRQRYHGFPTELLTRIVDGRQTVRGHGSIEMPVWGDAFRSGSVSDEAVRQKILALVQYLEAIQARNTH